jgi:DNA-binding transcriptional regulator YhcF (GntR family)
MTDTYSVNWHIDRELPISLHEQIKGQITYAIIYGELGSGIPLPSIREMASLLKVSMMTVSSVYRELVSEGLVVSQPRVGYFVAPTNSINGSIYSRNTQRNLRQIMDNSIRQALLLGHSIDEVREVFSNIVENYNPDAKSRYIVLAGNFMPATADYAADIQEIICNRDVKVIPVLISKIIEQEPQVLETIRHAGLVITIASRLQEVRNLLEPYSVPVAAVAFHLNPATRLRLSNIAHEQSVGIVTTYPEFLQTMIDQVVSYSQTDKPLLCAILGQDERIREMMSRIDVLVFASGSESVLQWVPDRVGTIEFRHTPEPESVRRLFAFDPVKNVEKEFRLVEPSNKGGTA